MTAASPGPRHRPPSTCPVCGDDLVLTRLGCDGCGTELAGGFQPCEFCALDGGDRELLRVFLRSRGNMKELERHLGVSYPTARSRFDALLARLDLADDAGAHDHDRVERGSEGGPSRHQERLELLQALARGEVGVDDALQQL